MKNKIILSSILVIALCICVIAGSTFALFTLDTEVNIAVTAGDLDVVASVTSDNMGVKSLRDNEFDYTTNTFANGGKAEYDTTTGKLALSNMTPGDAVRFYVNVENKGEISVKYRVNCEFQNVTNNFNNALDITVYAVDYDENGNEVLKPFIVDGKEVYPAIGMKNSTSKFVVTVEFRNGDNDGSNDNQYKGAKADIYFTVQAVQMNGVNDDGTIYQDPNLSGNN